MTYWSRYDPVSQPRGNTDHWSKMKIRSSDSLEEPNFWMRRWMEPHTSQYMGHRAPETAFDVAVHGGLNSNIPGSYHETRPQTSLPAITFRNSYHQRAKEGFRYWLIERPKPTLYGKYGIGSYKTVLGIGNGPRT